MMLQKKNLMLLKNLIVIGVLLTTGFVFLNLPANPLNIITSSIFIPVVLVYISLYFAWQILNNKTSIKIEVVPNIITVIPEKPKKHITRQKALLTFILASQILAVPFIIMIMQQIVYSNVNGTGQVISNWNHFGELAFETVIFTIVAIICFIGIIFNYKIWKSSG